MSSIAKKGLSATLLVFMLAAPVAAAAPVERPEGREGAAAAGWVSGLVEWVGGWLLGHGSREDGPRWDRRIKEGDVRNVAGAEDNGPSKDPNG